MFVILFVKDWNQGKWAERDWLHEPSKNSALDAV